MRVLLFILVLSASFYKTVGQSINPEGVTIVHIVCDRVPETIPLFAHVYHIFPAYDFSSVSDSLLPDRKQVWLQCPVRTTQNGYVFVGDEKLKLLMIPGDTVHLRIGTAATSPRTFTYSFEGRTTDEQAYYLAKKKEFATEPGQSGLNAGGDAKNLVAFRQQLDSLTQTELTFWNGYKAKHSLPDWFTRFESNEIRYNDAKLRLYMAWYQIYYQGKKQQIPADYYSFLDNIPVRNPQAQYSYEYLNFLDQYVQWKLKSANLLTDDPDKNQVVFDKLATQLLGDSLGDFYRIWSISSGVKDNPERAKADLNQSKFPAQYDYLVTYLRQRSDTKAAFLKAGDKAPAFFLTDTRDSLVSLSQFKGQAVYLCFWFATCGGCFHEFPFENKLVDQFNGKPVQIISICTSTEPDKWRETIKKVGLKTVNLFASRAWKKTLEEKYALSVYPHYVLIDAEGRIVENFATRPSNNAAAKIEQVLATMDTK